MQPGSEPVRAWVVLAALATTVTVSYGVLSYAFAVVLVPLQHDLSVSRLTVTGAFSVALAVSAVTGVLVGRLLDEHDPRLVMTGGSLAASALVVLWARVHSAAALYLVFAALGVCMAAVLYAPAFVVVTKWFSARRRASALGALTLVGAFASPIFSPLTERLTAAHGWRGALLVLAVILAATTVPLHLWGLARPPAHTAAEPVPPTGIATAAPLVPGRRFAWAAAAMGLGSVATSAILVHLVAILVDDGASASFAAAALGCLGLSQAIGRIGFAVLQPRTSDRGLAAATFALATVALVALAADRSGPAVIAFCVAFGASNGAQTLLGATMPATLAGVARYGRASGIVQACVSGGRAIAPLFGSAVLLLPGGSVTLLGTLAGIALAAGLAAETALRH